jgi:hypothetical protein
MFTPFHKPPYPYLYGKSVDETTTNTGPSNVANRGLTFVFDIQHPNWYIATRIRALSVSTSIGLNFREPKFTPESNLRHCWP